MFDYTQAGEHVVRQGAATIAYAESNRPTTASRLRKQQKSLKPLPGAARKNFTTEGKWSICSMSQTLKWCVPLPGS